MEVLEQPSLATGTKGSRWQPLPSYLSPRPWLSLYGLYLRPKGEVLEEQQVRGWGPPTSASKGVGRPCMQQAATSSIMMGATRGQVARLVLSCGS